MISYYQDLSYIGPASAKSDYFQAETPRDKWNLQKTSPGEFLVGEIPEGKTKKSGIMSNNDDKHNRNSNTMKLSIVV